MGCVWGKPRASAEPTRLQGKRLDREALCKPDHGKWAPKIEALPYMEKSNVLGLLRISVGTAKMLTGAAHYNVTLAMGLQYNVVLQDVGDHVLHLMVHRVKQLDVFSHSNVGIGEINLKQIVDETTATPASAHRRLRQAGALILDKTEIELRDPGDITRKVGTIEISVQSTAPEDLENNFWHRLIDLVDYDDSGTLDFDEFRVMMQGLTGVDRLSDDQLQDLWARACGGGEVVDVDALCKLLTETRDAFGHSLIQTCPITGRELDQNDRFGSIVYMTLVMDGGLGRNLQGGFRTAQQANREWIMQMSEWVVRSSMDPGLNVGAKSAHIIVYDRVHKKLTEEVISSTIVLAMRNMYQSSLGRLMKSTGAFKLLKLTRTIVQHLSEEKGRAMDDPASVADIAAFVKAYKGQVDLSEMLDPIESFKTFNEFFYRKLKPSSRPIAFPDDPQVLVSAADCRLTAFETISDATLFWVKGSHFSVRGLLADVSGSESASYAEGSMVIFRLAPQDYHRFHSPCNCTVISIAPVSGQLYTVNPIAVNSHSCDVFTENKRVVVTLLSPEFGELKVIAVGATLVGSIAFTVEVGQSVRKGEELGYFAFGGSTVICLFQRGRVKFDDDLLSMSRKSIETYLKMGVHIGKLPGTMHADAEAAFNVPQAVEASAADVATTLHTPSIRKPLATVANKWQHAANLAFMAELMSSADGPPANAQALPPPVICTEPHISPEAVHLEAIAKEEAARASRSQDGSVYDVVKRLQASGALEGRGEGGSSGA